MSPIADLLPPTCAEFFGTLRHLCAVLGWNPEHLLSVMMSESAIKANAHNPHGHASGLIQFMPDTLRGLGWLAGDDAFRTLTAEQQLLYVEKYYTPYHGLRLDTPERFYLATFLPAYLSNPESHASTFVLCGANGPFAWAYSANRVFDRDAKGWITVGDLAAAIARNCVGARWEAAISALRGVPVETPTDPGLGDAAPEVTVLGGAVLHPDTLDAALEDAQKDPEG